MIEFTLIGAVPSKKNAWRRGSNKQVYLPTQMQADIDALIYQAQSKRHQLDLNSLKGKRLHASVCFVLPRQNEDLDNIFTTLLDVLQKSGIVENDKLIRSFSVSEIITSKMPEQTFVIIHAI